MVVLGMTSCIMPQSGTVSGTALLVPSRYTLVELAFNIREFRPVQLLIFDSAKANLYAWHTSERKWLKTTADDINRIPEFELNKIIVIGTERDIPQSFVNTLQKPAVSVERISSYDFKTVFNELNRHFKFSLSEWEYFAKTYDLTIEDRNAERRRWGKYGKPGSPKPLKQLQPVVMPEEIEQPKSTSPGVIQSITSPTGSAQEKVKAESVISPSVSTKEKASPSPEVKRVSPEDK